MRKRQIKQLPFQFKEGEAYLQKIAEEFGESAQIISEPVQISGRSEHAKAIYQVIIAVEESAASRAAAASSYAARPASAAEEEIAAQMRPAAKKSYAASAYEKEDAVSVEFSPRARAVVAAASKKPMIDAELFVQGFEGEYAGDLASDYAGETASADEKRHSAHFSPQETIALAKQYGQKRAAAGQNASNEQLIKEISKLRAQVDSLSEMRWGELAFERGELDIPKEFAAIYERAKNSGMARAHLEAIMAATKKNLPRSMYANTAAIRKYFHNFLASLLPCRVDAPIRKQKIMMLIGPTGVGKTTTLAKLAYKYRYGEPRYKVALISLDDFRLGAKEQLAEYAALMKIPLRYISCAEDFGVAIEELAGFDVVLIDSTGNSQYDKKKINKLEGYLNASSAQIDATLVLSAGMKLEDMQEAYAAFDELRIDSLIFTKFDESKSFGNIFSLVYEKKKPVSFFSIGQNVPDDLMSANKQFLASCLLDGFSQTNE